MIFISSVLHFKKGILYIINESGVYVITNHKILVNNNSAEIINGDLKNETTKQLEIFADQTEHAGKITDPPNEKLRDILESYTRKQFQNVLKSVETLEKDYLYVFLS